MIAGGITFLAGMAAGAIVFYFLFPRTLAKRMNREFLKNEVRTREQYLREAAKAGICIDETWTNGMILVALRQRTES